MDTTQAVETYMSPGLSEALVKFHQKAIVIKQEGSANYGKYATYEQVIKKIRPEMHKQGLFFQHISHPANGGAAVETVIYGHGGQLSSGIVRIPASKQDEHKYGGALTYAKRYSLNLALGLGGDPDPIEESAEEDLPTVVEAREEAKAEKKQARKAAASNDTDQKQQRSALWTQAGFEKATSTEAAREAYKVYEKGCRNRGLDPMPSIFESWLKEQKFDA